MKQIKTVCPLCGKETIIEVEESAWEQYEAGDLAQNCFPDLSPDKREMLISGICPECFDKAFPDEE